MNIPLVHLNAQQDPTWIPSETGIEHARPTLAPSIPSLVLSALRDDLSHLNDCTAQELLLVANNLEEISRKAREITALSQAAARWTASEDSQQAIATLQQMLADTEQVQGFIDSSRGELTDIVSSLKESRVALSRMMQLPQQLSSIALLARIEVSRISGTAGGVSLLVDEIHHLGQQIGDYLNDLSLKTERVTQMVLSSLHDTNRSEGELDSQRAALVDHTRTVLDSLLSRIRGANASARAIDERYAGIRSAIDKTVMSLQVQDIARQRIEHVREALSGLEQDQKDVASSCGPVLALQQSQTLATRDLVSSSIDTIMESLQSVSERISELTADTAALASQNDENRGSFSSTIQRGLDVIFPVFAHYRESSEKVISAFDGVIQAVNEISDGVHKLDRIQTKTHLTALNALIETGRLGDEGVALKTIGSEVQAIARQSRRDTEQLLNVLTEINELTQARSVRNTRSPEHEHTSDHAEQLRSELKRLSTAFVGESRHISENLNSMLQQVDNLRTDLSAASNLANRKQTVLGTFDSVVGTFSSILTQIGYTAAQGSSLIGENAGTNLASLYSMESERHVHHQHFHTQNSAGIPDETTGTDYSKLNPGDDGVELF